jgi:hypothetical protein
MTLMEMVVVDVLSDHTGVTEKVILCQSASTSTAPRVVLSHNHCCFQVGSMQSVTSLTATAAAVHICAACWQTMALAVVHAVCASTIV